MHVTLLQTTTATDLAAKVRNALMRAFSDDSNLTTDILKMDGMSGRRYRLFINNLIQSIDDPRYLEIGTFAGSTLCSAVFGTCATATGIDNWSQFGGPAAKFHANLARFKGEARVSFLDRDYRQVDFTTLGPFGVYLFDGPHDVESQCDGIMRVQAALDDTYVQIIDDWNWPSPRKGTMRAIAQLGLRIDFMAEIRTTLNDQHAAPPGFQNSDWHNGCCIAVLSKKH